jgi:integrase
MRITQKVVDNLKPVDRRKVFFDDEIKGFGLKAGPPSGKSPRGSRSYVFEYRPHGSGRSTAKRRYRIGSAEDMTAQEARDRATKIRADVRNGIDPSDDLSRKRAEMTLAELTEEYRRDKTAEWKPNTLANFNAQWGKHMLPRFGQRKLSEIGADDLRAMHRHLWKVDATPFVANRVIVLAKAFWNWRAITDPTFQLKNPAVGVKLTKEDSRRSYLTPADVRRLFAALDDAVTIGVPWQERKEWRKHTPRPEYRRTFVAPAAAAAIKVLAFTGCRLREVLHLTWGEVDLVGGLLLLKDSKTGRRSIPLSAASATMLQGLFDGLLDAPKPEGYVFSEVPGGPPRADLHRPWRAVCRAAGLPSGTRIHDLRHTAASMLINSGHGLEMVAGLLGHKSVATARRYSHLMDSTVRAAAEAVSTQISGPFLIEAPVVLVEDPDEEDLIG